MPKVIEVSLQGGSVWHVDAVLVAKHRADYYSESKKYEIGSYVWQKEVDWALDRKSVLVDWMLGRMLRSDHKAVMVTPPRPTSYATIFADENATYAVKEIP